MTKVPVPRTWVKDDLIQASLLNAELRDPLKYIACSNQTSVVRSSTQTINDSNLTAINWDTQKEDVDKIIDVPGTTFTFTRSGVMEVRAHVYWPGSSTAGRQLMARYKVSGGSEVDYGGCLDGACSEAGHQEMSFALPVGIGDQLYFNVYQDSGGGLDITADCTVRWVGAVPDWIDVDVTPPPPKPGGSGGGDSAPPPAVKKKYTKRYYCTWSATYTGGGSQISGRANLDCYQGENGPGGGAGNERSLAGFDYAQIKSDLSGATNIHVTLKHHYQWSYFSGFWCVIGSHNYTSEPGTWDGGHVDDNILQDNTGPGWHELDLPSEFGKGLQSGAVKGIAYGPGPSSNGKYNGAISGYANGLGINKPSLEVSYYK